VEELDKAPDKLPLPVNQGAIMTDQFVVWMASSDGELRDWEIWGYNIGKGKNVSNCFEQRLHNTTESSHISVLAYYKI